MRIAQLLIQPYIFPPLSESNTLPTTHQGDQGFGSTGTSARRDSSHLPTDLAHHLQPQPVPRQQAFITPSLPAIAEQSKEVTKEKGEADQIDDMSFTLLALDDKDWENTWEHHDETPTPVSGKAYSSIP
eukprot:12989884-Ditylum_brightwellii.AAC.1